MILFTKEYLPTSVIFFLVLIFRLWSFLLSQHVFRSLSPVAFQARLPVYALKRVYIRVLNLHCAKVSQPDSFLLFANLVALFCTRFMALTWALYGSQHTSPYSSIGLTAQYKLNVSCYYFPFWVFALRNEVPSMFLVVCNLHDLPSLNSCV